MAAIGKGQFMDIHASADFLAPGAIETNRYQAEIVDRLRRRFAFGQRISLTPATGHPSRYFEQVGLPAAAFNDPRRLAPVASQGSRIEQTVPLKAITAQLNYGLFDVEVNQQQNQFGYLEAKDLSDTVDSVLRTHDLALWNGNDTSTTLPTSVQYYGVSGQIINAQAIAGVAPNQVVVAATGSLVDAVKHQVAVMGSSQIYEVRPSAFYSNALGLDLFDREAKQYQLYFNKVQIMPGVIVQGLPTQLGILPFINDPAITVFGPGGAPSYGQAGSTYTGFIISEDMIEYHWLTNPMPRVFQLGLTGNLASQYSIVKFGAVIVKGAAYAHNVVLFTR